MAWGAVLGVVGTALVVRTALLGTLVDEDGLVRVSMFRRRRLAWRDISRFMDGAHDRAGLWVVPRATDADPMQVPSVLHGLGPDVARDVANGLNTTFRTDRPQDPVGESSGGAGWLERWAKWTWYIPLVTVGYGTVFVLLIGATKTMRRWLWLVAIGSMDAIVVGVFVTGPTQGIVVNWLIPMTLMVVGPSVLILCVWRRERRMRPRTGMGEPFDEAPSVIPDRIR